VFSFGGCDVKTVRDVILEFLHLKWWQAGRSKEYQEDARRSYRDAYRKGPPKKPGRKA
jgi:hypothetical protein